MAIVTGNSFSERYMGEYHRLTGSWKDGAPVYLNMEQNTFLYYCGEFKV